MVKGGKRGSTNGVPSMGSSKPRLAAKLPIPRKAAHEELEQRLAAQRAVLEVRKMGQVVKTRDGNAVQNPFLGIMNRQALLMAKFGSELSFSPAA